MAHRNSGFTMVIFHSHVYVYQRLVKVISYLLFLFNLVVIVNDPY